MNYKIGDKVETPFGVGIITHIDEFDNEIKEDIYWVQIKKAPEIYFNEEHLQYYKTAHDKLLELGWVQQKGTAEHVKMYAHEDYDTGLLCINKDIKQWFYSLLTYTDFFVDLELSKILTQYLEELEDE